MTDWIATDLDSTLFNRAWAAEDAIPATWNLELDSSRTASSWMKSGTHRLLEVLPSAAIADVPKLAKRRGLEVKLAHELFQLVNRPDLQPFFGLGSSAETAIMGRIDGIGRVSGRVDRFAETPEVIYLLDYKSGRRDANHLDQMALYAAVLAEAYSGRVVRAALLWTHSLDLQWLDPNDLSRTLEALRRNISGPVA